MSYDLDHNQHDHHDYPDPHDHPDHHHHHHHHCKVGDIVLPTGEEDNRQVTVPQGEVNAIKTNYLRIWGHCQKISSQRTVAEPHIHPSIISD